MREDIHRAVSSLALWICAHYLQKWRQLTAVAHTLPYDAQLLESHPAGKPLSDKDCSSVTIPTLVMAGGESPAFLRHDAQALAEALPHARLLTQKGLGHTKQLSPKVIASVLVEFFEGY